MVKPTEPAQLNVFVYGTLKRGQSNHERFCQGVLTVREATVPGRQYELPFSFPALIVSETYVLATGTTDYLADAKKQNHASPNQRASLPSSTVHGQLMTFDDPADRLIALDALEG